MQARSTKGCLVTKRSGTQCSGVKELSIAFKVPSAETPRQKLALKTESGLSQPEPCRFRIFILWGYSFWLFVDSAARQDLPDRHATLEIVKQFFVFMGHASQAHVVSKNVHATPDMRDRPAIIRVRVGHSADLILLCTIILLVNTTLRYWKTI